MIFGKVDKMNILLLFLTAIMWSFVGVMVKSASMMVGSSVITLSRFLFGVVFLGLYLLIKKKKIKLLWRNKWIWFGVIGKSINYLFENLAISMGFAYGNIIVWPVQAIFIAFVAVFYFDEKIYFKKLLAIILCICGVLLVSWKGVPLKEFFGQSFLITILFVISAIGAGVHVISQKKLIETMGSGNMNLSIFLYSAIFTAIPVPFNFQITGDLNIWPVISLLGLGFVTGISFYIYAKALKKTPLIIAVIISNSSVLFTLLWSRLFFQEPINIFVKVGALLLLTGLIVLNIPKKKKQIEIAG